VRCGSRLRSSCSAPNCTGPTTIFSFDHGTGILYTCECLRLHYCSRCRFLDVDPGHRPRLPLYYDWPWMGPNARSVFAGPLSAWTPAEVSLIATGPRPLAARITSTSGIGDITADWSSQRSAGATYAAVLLSEPVRLLWTGSSPGPGRAASAGRQPAQLVEPALHRPPGARRLIGRGSAVLVPTLAANPMSKPSSRSHAWLAALQRQGSGWPSNDAYGGTRPADRQHRRQAAKPGQKKPSRRCVQKVPGWQRLSALRGSGTDPGPVLTLAAPDHRAMKALRTVTSNKAARATQRRPLHRDRPGQEGAQQRHVASLGEPGQL